MGVTQKIVFIGINSLFSAAHLDAVGRAFRVSAVYETVRPLGRLKRLERRLVPSRLAVAAEGAGAVFREVAHGDTTALTRLLEGERPDLVVIAGMGWLLDPAALAVPRLGTVNVHPALLPAYRGPEPFFWQLFDGVDEGGVTVHLVDRGEDHGPIVGQRSFPLPHGASLADLLALTIEHGPRLLVHAIGTTLEGTSRPTPQPDLSPTSRARRLRPGDKGLLALQDWTLERAWRVLRGVGPVLGWPRPRWRDLGHVPVIGAATGEPAKLPAGHVGRDAGRYYIAHPNGRIGFEYRWRPRAWLAAMRRQDGIASGIVAAEQAAGLPSAGARPTAGASRD
jgi:methionyl-tRNA formyltransferase